MSARRRYPLLAAAAVVADLYGYFRSRHVGNDWSFFNVGARVLVHYQHRALYGDPRLHLYVDNPNLQIGPPPLELLASLYWIDFRALDVVFGIVMALLGVVAFGCIERVGHTLAPALSVGWHARLSGVAGLLVTCTWGYYGGAWKHLDDAIAIALVAVAALCIAQGRQWWLVGILLGTALATKPWALVLVPVLWGLPRRRRATTTLVVLAVGAFWWLPFVVAAPGTVDALGQFHVLVRPGSVLQLFGGHGEVQRWLRPTQFVAGAAVGTLVAARGHWYAAPLAALAVRVGTDAYTYGYYALGPVVFACLWDLTGPHARRAPFAFTGATVLALCVFPVTGAGPTASAVVRLCWVLAVLGAVAAAGRAGRDPEGAEQATYGDRAGQGAAYRIRARQKECAATTSK